MNKLFVLHSFITPTLNGDTFLTLVWEKDGLLYTSVETERKIYGFEPLVVLDGWTLIPKPDHIKQLIKVGFISPIAFRLICGTIWCGSPSVVSEMVKNHRES